MAETTVTTKGPVGQRLALYVPASDLAESCGVCKWFESYGCCDIVSGTISADYTCRYFTAADPAEEGAEAAALAEAYEQARQRELAQMNGGDTPDVAMAKTEFHIAKIDQAQRRVFGWANIAVDKTGTEVVDAHGDIIDAEALEAAAYGHVLDYRKSGVDHNGAEPVGDLIESMFFDTAKAEALGIPAGVLPHAGWFVGYEFRDTPEGHAAFKSVVDGHRPAFSIEGMAQVEDL